MDFYEAKDFFKQMYPNKLVEYNFDNSCIRQVDCVFTKNQIHANCHIEYRQVRVTVGGQESFYVPIEPHRMIITCKELKKLIHDSDVFIHPDEIANVKDMIARKDPDVPHKLAELAEHTGLDEAAIMSRL